MGSVSKGSDSIDYQRGQTRLIGDRGSGIGDRGSGIGYRGSGIGYQISKGSDSIDKYPSGVQSLQPRWGRPNTHHLNQAGRRGKARRLRWRVSW